MQASAALHAIPAVVQALTEIKAVRQKLHKSGNRAAVTVALGRAERELRHQVAVSLAMSWAEGRGLWLCACSCWVPSCLPHSAIDLLLQTFRDW